MDYHFRNLVFEGGGVKGIAYVGALGVLEQRGILKDIKRVGGASAGAIIALLIGLGYSLAELENILTTLNFKNFLDDSWGFIRDAKRIVDEYGLYKGDFFLHWAAEKVKEKTGNPNATFEDISNLARNDKRFRAMYIMGVNLSTGYAKVFSTEKTPSTSVAYAVRISMSIPLFFAAIRFPRGDVYVDGGVIDNYPIKLFDRAKYVDKYSAIPLYYQKHNEELDELVKAKLVNDGKPLSPYVYNKETLGFRLDTATEIGVFRDDKEPPTRQISNLVDYAKALWSGLTGVQQSMHLHSDDWQRSIYIDTKGVGTTDFGLSDERKQALKDSGKKGAEEYFKWYDEPKNGAVNRPTD
jgi:NTE family protein